MSYKIDLQKIADKLDFDLDDVEMLMDVFLEGVQESLKKLETAIDTNDLEQIFQLAHAIKGSAANLTLMDISDLAKVIESESRAGNDINYLEKFEILKEIDF